MSALRVGGRYPTLLYPTPPYPTLPHPTLPCPNPFSLLPSRPSMASFSLLRPAPPCSTLSNHTLPHPASTYPSRLSSTQPEPTRCDPTLPFHTLPCTCPALLLTGDWQAAKDGEGHGERCARRDTRRALQLRARQSGHRDPQARVLRLRARLEPAGEALKE